MPAVTHCADANLRSGVTIDTCRRRAHTPKYIPASVYGTGSNIRIVYFELTSSEEFSSF